MLINWRLCTLFFLISDIRARLSQWCHLPSYCCVHPPLFQSSPAFLEEFWKIQLGSEMEAAGANFTRSFHLLYILLHFPGDRSEFPGSLSSLQKLSVAEGFLQLLGTGSDHFHPLKKVESSLTLPTAGFLSTLDTSCLVLRLSWVEISQDSWLDPPLLLKAVLLETLYLTLAVPQSFLISYRYPLAAELCPYWCATRHNSLKAKKPQQHLQNTQDPGHCQSANLRHSSGQQMCPSILHRREPVMTSTSCFLLLLMLCSGLDEMSCHGAWSPALAMEGLHQFADTDQQAEESHFPCCIKSEVASLPHQGNLYPQLFLASPLALPPPLHHRPQAFLSF